MAAPFPVQDLDERTADVAAAEKADANDAVTGAGMPPFVTRTR